MTYLKRKTNWKYWHIYFTFMWKCLPIEVPDLNDQFYNRKINSTLEKIKNNPGEIINMKPRMSVTLSRDIIVDTTMPLFRIEWSYENNIIVITGTVYN